MCRLELTPRNRDRWSREIQIMKKLVILMHFLLFPTLYCYHVNCLRVMLNQRCYDPIMLLLHSSHNLFGHSVRF